MDFLPIWANNCKECDIGYDAHIVSVGSILHEVVRG